MENMDLNNIMERIENIKKRMAQLEQELSEITVEGKDDNNIITALVSGKGKVKDYKLNLQKIGGLNQEKLKKALVQATNDGLRKAKELEAKKKKEIVGDINLPDVPGLF